MSLAPYDLDVRPILREGGEPFSVIMAAVAALAPGQPLRLLATFKPIPLFQVLGTRGFDAAAREIGDGDWEVIFTPAEAPPAQEPAARPVASNPDQGWPEPEFELDLRDLVTSLAEVEHARGDAAVHDGVGKSQLRIEFERARLHCHRP